MNIATVDGHIGKDATLRTFNDNSVVSFSLANSVGYGDKKETQWFNCSLWGKFGEVYLKSLKKGVKVVVVGEFLLKTFQKDDGTESKNLNLRVSQIAVLEPKKDRSVEETGVDEDGEIPF